MSQFDFSQILDALQEPFPSNEVEFKPGATNREKTKALALAYVDSRPYIQRLNLVCPDWQDEYQVMMQPDRVVVLCRLTIAGVTRTGDGECLIAGEEGERTEPNAVTTASAQAFKRACVKFGLGAYLYALPQVWCDYDAQKRKIVNPPKLPDWAIPSGEKVGRRFEAAAEREAAEKGIRGAEDAIRELFGDDPNEPPKPAKPAAKPAPAAEAAGEGELADPGQTVIHFGKQKDKTLAEVWQSGPVGQGWVRWCANTDGKGFDTKNDPKNVHLQRMARAFLALQAAYAG
ncbi:MAG: hypothetical protein KatS3mg047_1450 [Bellilinea sp.]|nr:MAG: hypothetical protein KatS3mg047_1450 [Bellilinea sp.]